MNQDDIDALETLKKLQAILTAPEKFYIHYNPANGKIMHFRNYLEECEYPFLEFSKDQIDLEMSINDWQVIEVDGTRQLKPKEKFVDTISKVQDTIHRINKEKANLNKKISHANYQYDLLIEQDNTKKEFRIRVSGAVKEQYSEISQTKQLISCYVTAEDDPYILYKTLEIPLIVLLENEYYTIPYDTFDGTDCNVFAFRYFQNYLHLVIE